MESARLIKWPESRVCSLFRLAVTNDLESPVGCVVNSKVHDVLLM